MTLGSGVYRALKLPTVVLACKSDLERQLEPQKALEVLQVYDVGLVEVANTPEGKEKMRRSFDWLLKAIFRERSGTSQWRWLQQLLTILSQDQLEVNLIHIIEIRHRRMS